VPILRSSYLTPTEHEWICPECRTLNVDDYAETPFPYCEICHDEFNWGELLSEEEQEELDALIYQEE
jgi:hypothetical protein